MERSSLDCLLLTRYYQISIPLAAGEILRSEKQIIEGSDDYYWRGVSADAVAETSFSIKFRLNDRYWLSNVRVPLALGYGSGFSSRALTPDFCVPAGGSIGFEIENLSMDFSVTARFLLVGVNRRMVQPC